MQDELDAAKFRNREYSVEIARLNTQLAEQQHKIDKLEIGHKNIIFWVHRWWSKNGSSTIGESLIFDQAKEALGLSDLEPSSYFPWELKEIDE